MQVTAASGKPGFFHLPMPHRVLGSDASASDDGQAFVGG